MTVCDQCDGSGFVWERQEDRDVVRECECRRVLKLEHVLKRAGLPERYQQASFDTFDVKVSASAREAVRQAQHYADEFLMHKDRGLLFHGSVGTGKTHLSIAVLRRLTLDYGVRTAFVDFRDLLKRIQATMRNSAAKREEVLQPILDAEALVLDEIGAARATDWTFEIVEEVLNRRYNDARATILTTNLPNLPCAAERTDTGGAGYGRMALMEVESLGDRIGTRMFSRVQQMCLPVELAGPDFRRRH